MMTVDKFGRYLQNNNNNNNNNQKASRSLKVLKHTVDCEDRLLRNVRKGILKNDVVIKAQLDDVLIHCLDKIKKISQNLEVISGKISTTYATTEPKHATTTAAAKTTTT